MLSRHVWVVVLGMAFGCGGDAHPDASVPLIEASIEAGPPPSRCDALENEVRAAIATRGTCETAADCTLVAGPEFLACDGEPYVIDCGGVPIENNAPGLERARTLTHEFFTTHCDDGRPGVFDCAPQEVHCGADHRCTGTLRGCLPLPPDAGVDAAIDAP